ncbi:MAG TPA: CDP-alcohol phosphatidyltransferase family protein [Polyangiaceae bacterium]|nr:CDP-alcohol phosphatidyltransferase family protein [Polyangiaceae bacterium]
MGFWDAYFRSLKPLEVEEPIDVWVHRPPAYVLARMLLPTPVSPNLVTIGSIVVGCAAGVAIFARFPWHLPLAGLLIFCSAVLDCCDGQLARLRKTSSVFGRMLDGIADLVVSAVVAGGGAWLVLRKYNDPLWFLLLTLVLTVTTILTSSFHTTMYDHFKNVFLRMTHPSYREGEDLSVAEARFQSQRSGMSFALRFAWGIYFFYMRSQDDYAKKFDPTSRQLLSANPEFNERNAAIYRKYAGSLMRLWRNFFGFGSLVFGLAVSIGLDVAEFYLLFRLVLLNAVFFGYLRPQQRQASRRTLAEINSSHEPAS